MSCSICGSLERAYEAVLDEYLEARSSARYRVSTVLAAQKNVDWSARDMNWKSTSAPVLPSIIPLLS